MSITIQHHPDKFEVRDFTDNPDPFAIVEAVEGGTKVSLFLHTVADADELIKAAVEAKRLLSPPVTEPEPVCPALSDAGALCVSGHHPHQMPHRDRDGAEWAGADVVTAEIYCGADWGSATTSQRCTKLDGHDGEHLDADGWSWGSTPHSTPHRHHADAAASRA